MSVVKTQATICSCMNLPERKSLIWEVRRQLFSQLLQIM